MSIHHSIKHLLVMATLSQACLASDPLITGHRGASATAPENTLAAFRQAWSDGADAIEGDFRLTADGALVCIHDADTKRVTGYDRVVASCTLAELKQLDFGAWKDRRFQGESCPTFAEVCRTLPPAGRFFVELKAGPEIVPPLAAAINRQPPGVAKRLLIITFDADTVLACKQTLPMVPVHWLTAFRKRPRTTGTWEPTAAAIATTVRRLGADGVGLQANRQVLTQAFLQRLKAGGVGEFHVWTVDDSDAAHYFLTAGAMGITTNRPAAVRASLGLR
jgi:glycerophosphoryl diester phosphodiesterase